MLSLFLGLAMLIPPAPHDSEEIPTIRIVWSDEEAKINDFYFFEPVVKNAKVKWSAEGPDGPLTLVDLGKSKQIMTGKTPGNLKIFAEVTLTRRYRFGYYGGSFEYDVPIVFKYVIHETDIKPYNPPLIK